MEKIANNIANKVALELNLDNERKEVIAYGTFALLQIIISIFLVSVLGWIFHVAFEALIVSFTTAILRKYSGGVHASSPNVCTFIGVVVCIGQAVLFKLLVSLYSNLNLILILGVIVFTFSYYLIYKLAPVDSVKKPIRKEEKRQRMKKCSILVLNLYVIIVAFLIFIYLETSWITLLNYSLCLYGGLIWQVFTLTNLGHFLVGKIDNFLNYNLEFFRR